MLTYQIHMLWLMLLELQKTQPQRVDFDATERELSIDEDRYGMEADEDSAGSKGNITEQDLKKRSGKNGFTQTAQNIYAKDEKDSKKQGRKQDFFTSADYFIFISAISQINCLLSSHPRQESVMDLPQTRSPICWQPYSMQLSIIRPFTRLRISGETERLCMTSRAIRICSLNCLPEFE